MVSESPGAGSRLTERERRWLDALLVVGTLAVSLVLVGLLANVLLYFGDILLVFFLAWLLAFVLSPVASVLERVTPGLPRGLAVLLTYGLLLVALLLVAVYAVQVFTSSLSAFVANAPALQRSLLGHPARPTRAGSTRSASRSTSRPRCRPSCVTCPRSPRPCRASRSPGSGSWATC